MLEDKTKLDKNQVNIGKIFFQSAITGVLCAIIILSYRYVSDYFLARFIRFTNFAKHNPKYIVIIALIFIILANIVSKFVKIEPRISGSGPDDVLNSLKNKKAENWAKTLFFKYFAGIIVLVSGLSVGIGGPAIQMGSLMGQGVSNIFKNKEDEHSYLLMAGSSSALAAAFNAPISGVIFAAEKLHKSANYVFLLSTAIAVFFASLVNKLIFGSTLRFSFFELSTLPFEHFWVLILLAFFVGLLALLFDLSVDKSKKIYKNIPVKFEYKVVFVFLLTLIAAFSFPMILGGGANWIGNLNFYKIGLASVSLIFLLKFIFTVFCVSSGVPAGLFTPALVIGALSGGVFGLIAVKYLAVPPEFLLNFSLIAMAASFAIILKAPITSMVFIIEMTGAIEQSFALILVVLIAELFTQLIKRKVLRI